MSQPFDDRHDDGGQNDQDSGNGSGSQPTGDSQPYDDRS